MPQEEGDQLVLLRTPGQRLRALPGSQSRQGGAFRGAAEQGTGRASGIGILQIHEGLGARMEAPRGQGLGLFCSLLYPLKTESGTQYVLNKCLLIEQMKG